MIPFPLRARGVEHQWNRLYTFWECPANANIQEEAVATTQNLCAAAVSLSTSEPCLWLRGILPAHHVRIESQYLLEDDYSITYTGDNPTYLWEHSIYYGDASGGEFTSISSLRMCGCGLATLSQTGELIAGASFPLPGSVQTVPRAKIFALVVLVQNAPCMAILEYITDNKGLYDTFSKGPKAGARATNSDLYDDIFNLTIEKAIRLSVRWMPSHMDEEGKPRKEIPD